MSKLKTGNKAETLAKLYNASRQQGLGFLSPRGRDGMTVEEAQQLVDENRYFDYLHGRVMKVDLRRDEFDPILYDRDNGKGAAERALAAV